MIGECGGGDMSPPPPVAEAALRMSNLFLNGRLLGSVDAAHLAHVAEALAADDPYGVARRLRPVRADGELRLRDLDAVLLRVSIGRIADGSPAAQAVLDVLRGPGGAAADGVGL